MSKKTYQIAMLCIFLAVWIWAAINPGNREAWLNENYITFVAVPVVIFLIRYFKLSNLSVTLITIFLCLHVIGGHFPYPDVPFGYTLAEWFNTARNQYDRLVHFSFGLLLFLPIREAFMKISKTRGFWTYYIPIDVVLALSAFFEIIELIVVGFIKPEQVAAFIGPQADIFDAPKDMLNAFVGALISMLIILVFNLLTVKKSRREFKKSFEVKGREITPEDRKIGRTIKKIKNDVRRLKIPNA